VTSPLSWPLAEWPERHRVAWELATAPADDLFGAGNPGAEFGSRKLESMREAHGQWLGFLARQGLLDPAEPPAAAAMPERLAAFAAEQRQRGNANTTIGKRLRYLHKTLSMLEPGADLGFILRPGGVPLSRAFPLVLHPVPVQDSRDLLRRALALHESGARGDAYAEGRAAIRDAAILGLLATRAPRVGAMAVMELGRHLARGDACYRVSFGEDDDKTDACLAYGLDTALTPVLDHYLSVVRPAFGGAATTKLWLSTRGRALNTAGIARIVRQRTADWFGEARGPHWFRKCLATTVALHAPHLALDAAAVLGHSPQVSLKHYNMATAVEAARRHDERVSQLKRETAGLAARAFRKEAGSRHSGSEGKDSGKSSSATSSAAATGRRAARSGTSTTPKARRRLPVGS